MKKNNRIVLKDVFNVLGIVILFVVLYSLILNLLFGGIVIGFLEDSFYYVQDSFRGQPKVFYDMRVIEYFTVDDKYHYSVKVAIREDRGLTPPFYYAGNYVHTLRIYNAIMEYQYYQASLLDDTFYVYVDGKLHIAPVFVEDQIPPR